MPTTQTNNTVQWVSQVSDPSDPHTIARWDDRSVITKINGMSAAETSMTIAEIVEVLTLLGGGSGAITALSQQSGVSRSKVQEFVRDGGVWLLPIAKYRLILACHQLKRLHEQSAQDISFQENPFAANTPGWVLWRALYFSVVPRHTDTIEVHVYGKQVSADWVRVMGMAWTDTQQADIAAFMEVVWRKSPQGWPNFKSRHIATEDVTVLAKMVGLRNNVWGDQLY